MVAIVVDPGQRLTNLVAVRERELRGRMKTETRAVVIGGGPIGIPDDSFQRRQSGVGDAADPAYFRCGA